MASFVSVELMTNEVYYFYLQGSDGVYDDTDCDNVDVNHAMVIVGGSCTTRGEPVGD
jgi:hypothetical protein